MRLEALAQLKNPNDLFGNRTINLPACSIVPQPTTLPHVHFWTVDKVKNSVILSPITVLKHPINHTASFVEMPTEKD
jgi:hypothetical protein